eukprot:COSAG04_NODE_2411_length_4181_cov_30.788084_3_plen_404_part_00
MPTPRALRSAVKRGDAKKVTALLADGADVHDVDQAGRSALTWAATQGYQQVVAAVLKHGADVDHIDNEGWTALMYGAYRGHADVTQELLGAGADRTPCAFCGDWEGRTALEIAEGRGHDECLALLRAATLEPAMEPAPKKAGKKKGKGKGKKEEVAPAPAPAPKKAALKIVEKGGDEDLMGDQSWAKTDDFSGGMGPQFEKMMGGQSVDEMKADLAAHRNAFSLDAAADSDTQSTQRLAVPNSPAEPFHQATTAAAAVPLAHKNDTLGFAEASWMLTVDSFAGIGVRPDNIPPAQIEAFRGAIMKETSGSQPSRRRKRNGRGGEQRLDLWVFKGGPKGSARSPCKSAESLLLLSLSPLSSRMFWIVRRGRIADREMLRHRHALHDASHPAQRPPLPYRHGRDK